MALGMLEIARQTVEFLYEENGGIPRDLKVEITIFLKYFRVKMGAWVKTCRGGRAVQVVNNVHASWLLKTQVQIPIEASV